jgi:hypothetical protein
MRRALVLASLMVATVINAAPAAAEHGHRAKEEGNAPAAIDITAIHANNARKRVKVRLVVPGLTNRGKFTLGYEGTYYDGMAIVVRDGSGGVTSTAWHCGEDSCAKVECRGIRVRWNVAKHYVSASVPQACYPLKIPKAWNFNGFSDLGNAYDSEYTKLRLRRG